MTLGDFRIVAVSDGTAVRDVERLVTRIPLPDLRALVARGRRDVAMELSINTFLVDTGRQRVLIDTGAGDLFEPEAGMLVRNLEAAGYPADRIDAVVLTHIHADHSGGLIHDGRKVFPNATIYVPQADLDLFLDEGAASRASAGSKHIFVEAQKCLGPYVRDRQIRTFRSNVEVLPGISSLPAPGHTPGHSAIAIESRGEKLIVLGDIVHVAEIQFDRPEAAVTLDLDQEAAVAERKKAFESAADGGYWVAFDHVSFPGVGHIRRSGDHFAWIPMPYSVRE